jgi:hypothetical protein
VAANESAQDLERTGKLVEAQAQLLTCAAKACPKLVQQDCSDRLQAVAKRLAAVVLVPKDDDGLDVTGAVLAIDGAARPEALDGKPVFVNPGPHTFTVTAAGRVPGSLKLTLGEGDQGRREVFVLKVSGGGRPEEGPAATAAVGREAEPAARAGHGVPGWIGWSAIGAGVAGIAVGSIYGLVALGKHSKLDRECPNRVCPAVTADDIQEYASDMSAQHVDATVADVAYGVGIVGLGVGAALLLFFPENGQRASAERGADVRVRPWVGLGNAGMTGTFR